MRSQLTCEMNVPCLLAHGLRNLDFPDLLGVSSHSHPWSSVAALWVMDSDHLCHPSVIALTRLSEIIL